MLHIKGSPCCSISMVGHTALWAQQSPDPPIVPTWWGGVFFPCCVLPNDTVNLESMVGVTPDDSFVVIGYQVHEYTHIWSAECFVAQSHIYPDFIGKV